MKIQITANIPPLLNQVEGYTYILPQGINEVENNSCMEISLGDILDYIPNRTEFIIVCIQKLRVNGIISWSGIDIVELAKKIVSGQLTIDETNQALYNGRQSIDNIFRIINFIAASGLELLDKRYLNNIYYIKAKRI